MWYTDSFGWPITARPYSSTSTFGLLEVSEVLNQIVRRACEFKPVEAKKLTTTAFTTTTTTTTTANLSAKRRANKAEGETDEALKEPVQATASYSDLVSLFKVQFFEKIIK